MLPLLILFEAELLELNVFHKAIETDFAAHRLVVIVASTTGHGDPPDNAARFWRKLKKGALDTILLRGMEYGVLALGDTNYDEFCQFGKVLDRRLAQLSATRIVPLGCADDAVGLDSVVEPWIADLWARLVMTPAPRPTAGATPAAEAPAVAAATAAVAPKSAPSAPQRLQAAAPLSAKVATAGGDASLLARLRSRRKQKAARATAAASVAAATAPAAPAAPVAVATATATATASPSPARAARAASDGDVSVPHIISHPRSFDAIVDASSREEVRAAIPAKLPRFTPCTVALEAASDDEASGRASAGASAGAGGGASAGASAGAGAGAAPARGAASGPGGSAEESDVPLPGSGQDAPYLATVAHASCLTARAGASHRVVRIDFDVGAMIWQPGDAIGVVCRNRGTLVAKLLERLDLRSVVIYFVEILLFAHSFVCTLFFCFHSNVSISAAARTTPFESFP